MTMSESATSKPTLTPEDDIDASRCAIVAVDTVIFTIRSGELCVLLIKVNHGYFEDWWAIPGGIVDVNETLDDTAKSRLEEKTGLTDVYLEQLYSFGEVKRDPRRRIVTVSYFALVNGEKAQLNKTDRYAAIEWIPIHKIQKLAYDHNAIIDYALLRLQYKMEYTNVVYSLMPEKFTLSELQKVYEIILEKKLDKRNFRRKLLSLDLIKENGVEIGVAHRPSKLYSFIDKKRKIIQVF
jgi:8-oxo-dGTP diphosphatase